jgi:hypothetical protein
VGWGEFRNGVVNEGMAVLNEEAKWLMGMYLMDELFG